MRQASGFTLLEIMVTIFILTVGLLGLAVLILRGQQTTADAYDRQMALSYVQFMAQKIIAGSPRRNGPVAQGARTALDPLPGYATSTNLAGAGQFSSSPSTQAGRDLYDWDQLLLGVNESMGSTSASGSSSSGGSSGGAGSGSGGTTGTPIGGIAAVRGCVVLANDIQTGTAKTAAPVWDQATSETALFSNTQGLAWPNYPTDPTFPINSQLVVWQVSVIWRSTQPSLAVNTATLNTCENAAATALGGNIRVVSVLVTSFR